MSFDDSLFQTRYQRNNKRGGLKNMRCFPTCGLRHKERGFCGRPVYVTLPPGTMDLQGLGQLHAYVEFQKADEAPTFGIGEVVPLGDIRAQTRSKDEPLKPFIKGEKVNLSELEGPQPPAGSVVFEFNREKRGWHYGWASNKHTCNASHCLRAYVLEEDERAKDDTGVVRRIVSSPEFMIFCRRRRRFTLVPSAPISEPKSSKRGSSGAGAGAAAGGASKRKRGGSDASYPGMVPLAKRGPGSLYGTGIGTSISLDKERVDNLLRRLQVVWHDMKKSARAAASATASAAATATSAAAGATALPPSGLPPNASLGMLPTSISTVSLSSLVGAVASSSSSSGASGVPVTDVGGGGGGGAFEFSFDPLLMDVLDLLAPDDENGDMFSFGGMPLASTATTTTAASMVGAPPPPPISTTSPASSFAFADHSGSAAVGGVAELDLDAPSASASSVASTQKKRSTAAASSRAKPTSRSGRGRRAAKDDDDDDEDDDEEEEDDDDGDEDEEDEEEEEADEAPPMSDAARHADNESRLRALALFLIEDVRFRESVRVLRETRAQAPDFDAFLGVLRDHVEVYMRRNGWTVADIDAMLAEPMPASASSAAPSSAYSAFTAFGGGDINLTGTWIQTKESERRMAEMRAQWGGSWVLSKLFEFMEHRFTVEHTGDELSCRLWPMPALKFKLDGAEHPWTLSLPLFRIDDWSYRAWTDQDARVVCVQHELENRRLTRKYSTTPDRNTLFSEVTLEILDEASGTYRSAGTVMQEAVREGSSASASPSSSASTAS